MSKRDGDEEIGGVPTLPPVMLRPSKRLNSAVDGDLSPEAASARRNSLLLVAATMVAVAMFLLLLTGSTGKSEPSKGPLEMLTTKVEDMKLSLEQLKEHNDAYARKLYRDKSMLIVEIREIHHTTAKLGFLLEKVILSLEQHLDSLEKELKAARETDTNFERLPVSLVVSNIFRTSKNLESSAEQNDKMVKFLKEAVDAIEKLRMETILLHGNYGDDEKSDPVSKSVEALEFVANDSD